MIGRIAMTKSLEFSSSYSLHRSITGCLSAILLLVFCAASEVQAGVLTVSTGSDPLANGDQFQNALKLAACGDTIVLQAGATYATRVTTVNSYGPQGYPFSLPNKSCASGQYVTIQTSQVANLPSGRISPSHIGLMATLATNTNSWVIEPALSAGNYQFIGIEFTNTANVAANRGNTPGLVFATAQNQAFGTWGHDMIFDRVWIHPYEEVSNPSGTVRSAAAGINLDGVNHTLKNSYISGFCCFAVSDGTVQNSVAVSIGTGPGPATITNNFIEAFNWNIFTGGTSARWDPASSPALNPANTATVTGATLTQATFSQTATLLVGDYVAFIVPAWTTPVGCSRTSGGGGFTTYANTVVVDTINQATGLVTYHSPGQCDDLENNPGHLPPDGSRAQWRGAKISGLTITGNTLSKRTEWCDGTKGYGLAKAIWEMKDASHVLFEGNISTLPDVFFDGTQTGCSSFTTALTANQDGTLPWLSTDANIFRNNIFYGVRDFKHLQPYPIHTTIPAQVGLTFTNNLINNNSRETFMSIGTFRASPGMTHTIRHNTARGMTNSILFGDSYFTAPNITFQDNIVTSGRYFMNSNTAFPNKTEDHNVIINNSGAVPPSYMSGDFVVASDAAVGFVNVTSADARGDYHGYALASTSPFKGRASDGTDPGVNFESLDAALALGASGSGGSSGGSGGSSGGSSVLSAPSNLTVR